MFNAVQVAKKLILDKKLAQYESYSDSAEGVSITKDRALQELKDHGMTEPEDIEAFIRDMGNKPKYDALEVLRWLGY